MPDSDKETMLYVSFVFLMILGAVLSVSGAVCTSGAAIVGGLVIQWATMSVFWIIERHTRQCLAAKND